MSRRFSTSFYRGDAEALSFVAPAYSADDEWRRRGAGKGISDSLCGELLRQNRCFGADSSALGSIARMRAGAVAVVTGQQVGLFTGPLYTLAKAGHAIRLAAELSAEGVDAVPVFWLQSEDHDLVEANRAHLSNGTDLSISGEWTARSSIAHCKLGPGVGDALVELENSIAGLPAAREVAACFRRHYRPEAGWVDAFAGVMAELFAETGLVFLNPRVEAVAELLAPLHLRSILDARAIETALREREKELEAAGFAVQVPVRESCALSFAHPEGIAGSRFRVRVGDERISLAGHESSWSIDEFEVLLAQKPLSVSSSALLRPVLQDSLLPTAAIVVGPGELNYFAQLAPLYAHFGLAMPAIVPRTNVAVVEPAVRRAMKKLDIALDDVDIDPGRWPGVDREVVDVADACAELGSRISQELESIESQVGLEDPAIARAMQKTREGIDFRLEKLAKRLQRVQLRHHDELRGRIDRVLSSLRPGGVPQERISNAAPFLARFGMRELVRALIRAKPEELGRTVAVEPPPLPMGV